MIKMGSYYVKKRQSQGKEESINYNNISLGRINSFIGSNANSSTNLNNSITESSILSLSRRNLSLITMDKWDYDVKDNPQYVAEYAREIFLDLKENENINSAKHGYLSTLQDDINDKMRAVLIDWLTEVHQKFKLNPETLYLTVNLIDRYLTVKKVERNRLQLVGVGAMLIASKYEEIYAPEVRDFVYITDKSYTKEEILKMEYLILTGLNFETLHVSPYTYLRRHHFITGDSMKTFYLAQYILEFSLLEYKMLLYSSSIKAAACLMTARKLLKLEPSWPTSLVKSSGYSGSELKPVVKDIVKILEIIPRITLRACINKFSTPKFLEVAKINMFN
jgi:G2/mitotic-specific cyclin-B, other